MKFQNNTIIFTIFSSFLHIGLVHGAKRSNETPVAKIIEIHSFVSIKLEVDEGQRVVNKSVNSDIIVGDGEDIDPRSKIVLECEAPYPVQWVYDGEGMPEYSTNTSTSKDDHTRPAMKFMSSASIGFQRKLGDYDSGKYTCRSLQDPKLSVYYNLYVVGKEKRLFLNKGGETITYKGNDKSVTIPCGVSNPKAAVSLQKSIDGLVQCPLNDSISHHPSLGFTLKVSPHFNPSGTYVCTAGYNGTYEVVEYTVFPEPERISSCEKNEHCRSHEACIREGSVKRCASPCTNLCGRNTQCNTINHIPKCRCLRGYSGNPYRGCFASTQQPGRNVCNPNPCGRNADCQNDYGSAKCFCHPGYQGNPYVNCYRKQYDPPKQNPCAKNPCGPYSICSTRNSYVSCRCKPGYVGQPPYCRPECNSDYNCNYDQICHAYKCKNPCDGACAGARCRVFNRQPICSYQFDCLDCHRHVVDLDDMDGIKSPCSPFPCGKGAECVPKREKNSVLNSTNVVAYCQCPENSKGDPYKDCSSVVTPENSTGATSSIDGSKDEANNDNNVKETEQVSCSTPCGRNSECTGNDVCSCRPNYQGNPYAECVRLNCTVATDCDIPDSFCIKNECYEQRINTKQERGGQSCGLNAVSTVLSEGEELNCSCPDGYAGNALIECVKISDDNVVKSENGVTAVNSSGTKVDSGVLTVKNSSS